MTGKRLDGPLDQAIFMVLVQHDVDVESRRTFLDPKTGHWTMPDLSDVHSRTRETIKALCSGEIDPDWWLGEYERNGKWLISPETTRGVYNEEGKT